MNIFTYGVLQHNRILNPLCGIDFSMRPARLSGYRKIFFNHEPFAPCAIIRPDDFASVNGQLLVNVDPAYTATLDSFECVDQGWYSRVECEVRTDDDVAHTAWVYTAGPEARPYFGDDWDEEYFLRSGRLDYLEQLLQGEFDPHKQKQAD